MVFSLLYHLLFSFSHSVPQRAGKKEERKKKILLFSQRESVPRAKRTEPKAEKKEAFLHKREYRKRRNKLFDNNFILFFLSYYPQEELTSLSLRKRGKTKEAKIPYPFLDGEVQEWREGAVRLNLFFVTSNSSSYSGGSDWLIAIAKGVGIIASLGRPISVLFTSSS